MPSHIPRCRGRLNRESACAVHAQYGTMRSSAFGAVRLLRRSAFAPFGIPRCSAFAPFGIPRRSAFAPFGISRRSAFRAVRHFAPLGSA
jgi:hypothetical protein